MTRTLSIFTIFGMCTIFGCDSDGDGLSNRAEKELGTDPEKSDSDGDGLDDNLEQEFGSDPLVVDTNGNGCDDLEEYNEDQGTLETVTYEGGWPFNPDKCLRWGRPGFDSDLSNLGNAVVEGEDIFFPRIELMDQYGEMVDIYDLAGQGQPIIVDLAGVWCYWCHEVAKVLEGRPSDFDEYANSRDMEWYHDLSGAIENGDIRFLTILDSDVDGDTLEYEDILVWTEGPPTGFDHGNDLIPVLGDFEQQFTRWWEPLGYPPMLLLDENMKVQTYNANDYIEAMNAALEMIE